MFILAHLFPVRKSQTHSCTCPKVLFQSEAEMVSCGNQENNARYTTESERQ